MDLNTIGTVARPTDRSMLPPPAHGDAFLAGGTWLFSEPQRDLARLIDLQALGWPAIEHPPGLLRLAATCTLARLDAFAADSSAAAAPLMRRCCRALWGSFKIWNAATIGGNLCLALPASPMAALMVALEARCTIWRPDNTERAVDAIDLVTAVRRTCLAPGELLRSLDLPAPVLDARFALRQASLTEEGRSACLLIGRRDGEGMVLTVTASVPRPLRLAFPHMPDPATLATALERAAAAPGWYDDPHGAPDWRRHMTLRLAGEIRADLYS